MCRTAIAIVSHCTCVRCNFGDVLNASRNGYYPHYGTTIVSPEEKSDLEIWFNDELREYSYIVVKPDDLCGLVALDVKGNYLCCEKTPDISEIKHVFERNPDGGADSLCDECMNYCFKLREEEGNSNSDSGDLAHLMDRLDASEDEIQESESGSSNLSQGRGQQQEERQLSMQERIYRGVFQVLGWPETAPIPFDPILDAMPPP
ncbi:hypothetical protein F5B22DRAFT_644074 [Xylaria bambusicola]|uniref:uncharacterized protein n=1 Tax=Xylaria bambusicola TaxID=326684 RepID=UPI002008D025|nr:uncharacterized protein F5B22DRAFT_644074 [Xylaria bambusicola]KAI0521347.1 hypothetical protein F5B22DRAFT_644074 [Xylaria bambusicola]